MVKHQACYSKLETSKAKSLEMLRIYRQKCPDSSSELGATYDTIFQYKEIVGDDRKSKYWEISVLYSEAFFGAGLNWADKAIAILEKEAEE